VASEYPTAAPGYGKRSAPSQYARAANDFAHLPDREAYLARFIDLLPDGAAIDAKTLARMQPRFGQQAVRSALHALDALGHLKRVLEKVGEGVTRWVYRTFFSRTARPVMWWQEFLQSRQFEGTRETPAEPGPPPRSQAYRALASLAAVTPKLMLSAKDCEELEPFAAEWFARGVTVEQFRHAMSNTLPDPVHHPGRFILRRLVDRVPPLPQDPFAARTECGRCRAPVMHTSASCSRCCSSLPGVPPVPEPSAQPPPPRVRLPANGATHPADGVELPDGGKHLADDVVLSDDDKHLLDDVVLPADLVLPDDMGLPHNSVKALAVAEAHAAIRAFVEKRDGPKSAGGGPPPPRPRRGGIRPPEPP
jgi:hypothetical protein